MKSIGRRMRKLSMPLAAALITISSSSASVCRAQQAVTAHFSNPYVNQNVQLRANVSTQGQPPAQMMQQPAPNMTPRPMIRMAGMPNSQSVLEAASTQTPAPSSQQTIPFHQYVNQPQPMTAPGMTQDSNCGYSRCNLPPQPQGIPSGCPECIVGLDCKDACYPQKWCEVKPIEFQKMWHGEYQGPIRLPAVEQYRMRVGDRLKFTYSYSREPINEDYRLMVGDELIVDSKTDPSVRSGDNTRGAAILPDGKIYLPLVGAVPAAGKSIEQLRRDLEKEYKPFITVPSIDVYPVKINTALDDVRAAVTGVFVSAGQNVFDTVHPDGTITLPKIGPICVLGLSQQEMKREINLRYRQIVVGLEVDPSIDAEAPHFVYVYGDVGKPDRYQLFGPTTVTQALAMAQSVTINGNSRQIVIFRRAEDWRLLSTRIDIKGVHLGKTGTPADEIWLRDNDLIIVPPTPVRRFDVFVRQVFTEGIYGIVPFQGISITNLQNGNISAN